MPDLYFRCITFLVLGSENTGDVTLVHLRIIQPLIFIGLAASIEKTTKLYGKRQAAEKKLM